VVLSELGAADLLDMLPLSVEAGWNQTGDDWAVFVRHGSVFGVRAGGRLVATAAALPYGPFGFVAMVLTARDHRGRGLATRLTARAIEALGAAVPVLDATAAGEPVYARLGFRPLFRIRRFFAPALSREAAASFPPPPARGAGGGVPPPGRLTGDTFRRMNPSPGPSRKERGEDDTEAFGADRGFLLQDFACRLGKCGPVRAGRTAAHIGPLVARSEPNAIAALAALAIPTPAIIDVPARWSGLSEWLIAQGFTIQREFTRMARGRDVPFGNPARIFATAGPEFG